MQLHDLVKPMDQQTDEELLERLRTIRHTRTVVRPAAKAHAARAEKKVTNKKNKQLEDLLSQLTPEEIQKLLGES